MAYGPTVAAYKQYDGIIVGTDGSLKDDGSMGDAQGRRQMLERIPTRSVAVFDSASSTLPERHDSYSLAALVLEECPSTDDRTILTDSLDSLTTLFRLTRADFSTSTECSW